MFTHHLLLLLPFITGFCSSYEINQPIKLRLEAGSVTGVGTIELAALGPVSSTSTAPVTETQTTIEDHTTTKITTAPLGDSTSSSREHTDSNTHSPNETTSTSALGDSTSLQERTESSKTHGSDEATKTSAPGASSSSPGASSSSPGASSSSPGHTSGVHTPSAPDCTTSTGRDCTTSVTKTPEPIPTTITHFKTVTILWPFFPLNATFPRNATNSTTSLHVTTSVKHPTPTPPETVILTESRSASTPSTMATKDMAQSKAYSRPPPLLPIIFIVGSFLMS